jgi:DNA-binding beta-propeller fold protein YncE/mono/diheme cytochrome c family protein
MAPAVQKTLPLAVASATFAAICAASMAILAANVFAAQSPPGPAPTAAQVAAGQTAYAEHCASCHSADLRGGDAPALIGATFRSTWGSRSAGDLLDYTSATMPQGAASLSADAYSSIVAFILQSNGLLSMSAAQAPPSSAAASRAAGAGRLLVLLRTASALAVVDPTSGRVSGRVPVVRDPHEVSVSDDGATAFVGSPSQGISVVDVAALKEARRIDPGTGSSPHDVLVSDGKLYFTAEGYKTIGRYDPTASRLDWMLGIGQDGTHLMVLAKDRRTMWVPNRGSNSVSVIDGLLDGPPRFKTTAIPVPGQRPEGIDMSPDGREVWTATRADGGVSIVDTTRRAVVQTLPLKLKDANRLKFTPDGRVLILDGGAGVLVVIDAASRRELSRVKVSLGGSGDGGLFVMPDGTRAYIGLRNDHDVVVVNLNTLEVEARWPMGDGSGPSAIAWTPTS